VVFFTQKAYPTIARRRRDELGAIVLKDGKLVQEPESIALNNLLSEPLIACDKSTRILNDAQVEPKKFLKHMAKCVWVVLLRWGG
jgi:hypothetical protein